MKVAILVGAGASSGAGAIQPTPPPLGGNLYSALRAGFPKSWGVLPADEDQAFTEWFESGMELLWQKAASESRPRKLLVEMAVYFSRFRPPADSSDAYSRLARGLVAAALRQQTVLASLNYDCLLERAMGQVGWPPIFDPRLERRPGRGLVLKPHGSCNILMPGGVSMTNNEFRGSGPIYDGDVRVVDPDTIEAHYARGEDVPPAMSLYSPGKPSPVAKTCIELMRRAWNECARNADVIVVIGARPYMADDHIWQPVLDARAEVWYVGGTSEREFSSFREDLGDRLTVVESDFADTVDSVVRRLQILP